MFHIVRKECFNHTYNYHEILLSNILTQNKPNEIHNQITLQLYT